MRFFTRTRTAPAWLRGAVVALAAAGTLPLAGCSTDSVLTVEDPDIIYPEQVTTAAGADAVRLGALTRLNAATSGIEDISGAASDGIFLIGGLFADEWLNGDSFIARQEVDQRVITPQNNFVTDANRALHRARLAAEQAIQLLAQYNPAAPAWQVAEMHFVMAYATNLLAEHFCSGLLFSTLGADGREQYSAPITTTAAFQRALKHAEDGLALVAAGTTANDVRVRHALQVTRGRILLNLNRPADAAAAVAGVPTGYRYQMLHSETTRSNVMWIRNNSQRRYTVGNREGGTTGTNGNGINFATAGDPRVPVCVGGDAACRAIGVTNNRRDDLLQPFHVQMIWTGRDASVTLVGGVEARLIEAEAQLRAGSAASALTALNALRVTATGGAGTGGVAGLAALTDAGTDRARVDQLFRERAFWLFSRGHRMGDLRRLIRQYARPANEAFPSGTWHKTGNYGADVTMPTPQAEQNNPELRGKEICMDRNA